MTVQKQCLSHISVILFMVIALVTVSPTGSGAVPKSNSQTQLQKMINLQSGFELAIRSLSRSVEFFSQNYEKVNLDAIYGLRVAEGFTHKALEAKIYPKELKEKIASFNELVDEVKELTSAAGSIAEKYFEMTMATSSTYTNIFREVIKEKWTYMLPHSSYDPNLVLPVEISESNYEESDPTAFNEHNSDVCMSNLMGTQEEGEKKPCVITDNCWTMMTRRKVGGYIITHQALYFMLADVRGCHAEVIEKAGSEDKRTEFLNHLGSNIYHQMKLLYGRGVPKEERDIFMEQIIVGSMLGIVDFFNPHYLMMVTEWQDKVGCIKDPVPDEENKPWDDPNYRKSSRNLKAETLIEGGCMSHMTGVATGLFGIYIYWFLNIPDYKKLGAENPWDPASNSWRVSLYKNSNLTLWSNSSTLAKLLIIIMVFMGAFFVRKCFKRRGLLRRAFLV